MSDFASILADVQRGAAERAATPLRAPRLRASLGKAAGAATRSTGEARRIYADHSLPDAAPREPDAAALRRAILSAGDDAPRLHALRRLAARALHPDRGGDGAALAECNAMIDAALRTSRRRI